MISASKIDLAKKCAWWARPDSPRAPYVPSKSADEGSAFHAEVEAFLRDGTPGTSELFAVWHAQWWAPTPPWMPGSVYEPTWKPETQVAMDPQTGKTMLGHSSRAQRDYRWIPRGWVSGTADAVRVYDRDGERWVHVVDWKTGRADYVTRIAENGQMRFLAAALGRHYGATRATIELAFVHLEGVQTERHELDCFDFYSIVEDLRKIVASVPAAEPNPGPHCRGKFCNSFGTVCPATTGKGRALIETQHFEPPPFAVALTVEEIESDAHAKWLYQAARQAQQRLGAIWEALRMRATIAPFEVAEGRVYSIGSVTRERLDASVPGAVDVLKKHLGDKADTALDFSTSKAAIKRAASEMKASGADVKIGALEAQIVEELRAIGAVKVTTSQVPDERPALTAGGG